MQSQARMTTTPTMPGTKAAVVAVPKNMEVRMLPLVSGVPGQQTAVVTPANSTPGSRRRGMSFWRKISMPMGIRVKIHTKASRPPKPKIMAISMNT